MNHQKYKEWIQLSIFEELYPDDQIELDQHLLECSECRTEQKELMNLHAMILQRKLIEPSDQLLGEARQQLRTAIAIERSRQSLWNRVALSVRTVVLPQYKVALGGVATLGIGIFLGYLVFYRSPENLPTPTQQPAVTTPIAEGETRIANVRFLDRDASDSEIEFTFEAVTPMRIKGSINDPRVQKVLVHSILNEQNPGTRLRSVSAIGAQADQKRYTDPEVKSALISALMYDENPGVRKEALTVLQRLPFDEEVKQAFLYVLSHDGNSALRIAAINSLDTSRAKGLGMDQEFLDVLKKKAQSDENNYVRVRARAVLQEAKQR